MTEVYDICMERIDTQRPTEQPIAGPAERRTEPWLRGTINDVHPVIAQVLYSLQHAWEDLDYFTSGPDAGADVVAPVEPGIGRISDPSHRRQH
jgi:hypothetical protein